MADQPPIRIRLLAIAAVLLIFSIIWLYTREYPVLGNTIGVRWLIIGAALTGAGLGAGILYALRRHLTPWENHLPEVFNIVIFTILIMPLFASLLNRVGGKTEFQTFLFESELPYVSSGYGILKGEKIKPTGYVLRVKDGDRLLRVQYKHQAYFPLTQAGERIMLPVCQGLLGFRVMELR